MDVFWIVGSVVLVVAVGMYWLLGREWHRAKPHPDEGRYRRGAP